MPKAEHTHSGRAAAPQRETAQISVQKSTHRALLGTTAALGAASAVPAEAQAALPRDQHVAWLSEYFRLRDIFNHTEPEVLGDDELAWEEMKQLDDLVMKTPPLTIEGCLAQLAGLVDNCMYAELPLDQLRSPLLLAIRWLRIETWRESV